MQVVVMAVAGRLAWVRSQERPTLPGPRLSVSAAPALIQVSSSRDQPNLEGDPHLLVMDPA